MFAFSIKDFVASQRYSHQSLGSCSAHPISSAIIGISASGTLTRSIGLPVSASTNAAFTKELPMSYPIAIIFYILVKLNFLSDDIYLLMPNEILSFAW